VANVENYSNYPLFLGFLRKFFSDLILVLTTGSAMLSLAAIATNENITLVALVNFSSKFSVDLARLGRYGSHVAKSTFAVVSL
jgi:hypothetical protein